MCGRVQGDWGARSAQEPAIFIWGHCRGILKEGILFRAAKREEAIRRVQSGRKGTQVEGTASTNGQRPKKTARGGSLEKKVHWNSSQRN
jgi:hypothetical protein